MDPYLTKPERKLLKKLIKESKSTKDGILPYDRTEKIPEAYYLKQLWSKKLIWDATLPGTPKNINGFIIENATMISPDGFHYLEKYHEYKLEQFLNGVIWPIIVATITSLIVNTPNWLPVLIKWMK